jgi:carboxypeptidase PM20D1
MIRLPTVSAEIGQRGLQPFREFEALLAELYPLVHERCERERITDLGLLYRLPGTGSDTDPAVLMAHYDVVPVGDDPHAEGWTHPPFDGVIADGWVFGRGALDDKGPMMVVLEAVESLLAEGFVPARDVYLSFGGDEESHGAAARAIADTFRRRGITPWIVLDEGGAVVDAPLPFVGGRAAMVGVGEKGVATIRLTARGEGGHASAPPRRTAIGRIARAVDRLAPGTFPARTPQAITRMLSLFADQSTGIARHVLRAFARMPRLTARVFAAVGGEPAALVRTTVAATLQTGGTAENVLPAAATATLNLRIALGETVAGTVRRVRRRIADRAVAVEVIEASEPSPQSPTEGAAFAVIAAAVAASYPDTRTVPYVMMAATDSRYFHRFSPAVYRFAPLRMSKAQRAAIHGVDERVEIASLERGVLFHRALLKGLPA